MSRTLALRILLGLLAALAVLLLVVALFDWNRAKPWLNARVSDATGRPFAINGDLSLQWQRGDGWLRPDLFRFGASGLLTDVERQLEHFVTGRYSAAHRHPMV